MHLAWRSGDHTLIDPQLENDQIPYESRLELLRPSINWFLIENNQFLYEYDLGSKAIEISEWKESTKEWPQELQAGLISNLIIFKLRIN